jgi:hypothetical protein
LVNSSKFVVGFWDFPFLLEVSTWQVVVGGLGLSGADLEGLFIYLFIYVKQV